jgi:hypothetical protein
LVIANGALFTVLTRCPARAYDKLREVAITRPSVELALFNSSLVHQDAARFGSEKVCPPAYRWPELERAIADPARNLQRGVVLTDVVLLEFRNPNIFQRFRLEHSHIIAFYAVAF